MKNKTLVIFAVAALAVSGAAVTMNAALASSGWSEQWDWGGFCPKCRDE